MNVLHRKKGASVTEFLVAVPILTLLLYAALDLNQMVEFRQGLVVATRNATFDRIGHSLHNLGTTDSLESQMAPFMTPDSAGDRGALSSNKEESANGFSASLGFHESRGKDALPEAQHGADATFENTSKTVGQLSSTVNSGLDGLTKLINLNGATGVWLLPPAKMRTVTATMAEIPGASALRKSMHMMSKTAENSNSPVISKTPGMSHMVYLRPETGYHPDGYVAQPLIGYVLGMQEDYAKWGKTGRPEYPNGPVENFNHACLMNFDGGGEECTDTNMMFMSIRLTGIFIRVFLMVAKMTPVFPAAVALDTNFYLVSMAAEYGAEIAIDKVTDYVADVVADEATKALEGTGLPANLSNPATLFNPGYSADDMTKFNGWDHLSQFKLAE